jgi:peptidyl-prolyl cis-trans isomerase D
MLDVLRQGQRWIMGAVILVVGGVFVAFVGVGGPLFRGSADTVVDVDGRHFSAQDLLRVRSQQEERAKQMLGDAYDAKAFGPQLDLMAANALVQAGLLEREAERLGIRVSDEEIVETVKSLPGFRDESGRFRRDALQGYIEYEYGTERRFLEALRGQLLAQKVLRLLSDTAAVSETEAREALRRQKEEVEIAYVAIDASKPGDDVAIEDAAIDAFVASDEPRIRDFYDGHPDRYNAPERVRARHILVRVPKDASDADKKKARDRAAQIRDRAAEPGADFEKLASELSEDTGSKARGGDLGPFQRGQMVKPFEEVAFVMEPGAISDVVETDFGFHVIQLVEKKPAESRAYDDVKREIARELLGLDAARKAAREQADALAKKVREGSSLEQAARDDGLTLERTAAIRRRPDGFVPGLGASPDLLATAFALTKEQPSSDRIFEVGDRLVLVQLLDRREPSADELAKEVDAVRKRLLEEERGLLQSSWIEAQRKDLESQGRVRVDLGALRNR